MEGYSRRWNACGRRYLVVERQQALCFGGACTVGRENACLDRGVVRREYLFENVFRRAESYHCLGIFRSDDGINTGLQRHYERWTECAQIHLALRRSQFASGIEQIVLHSDIGRVHVDIVVKAYIVEQTVDARRIFVDIDVFVPFDACYKFAVIYLWHPLYREHHEHGHAHRQDEAYSRHADCHMAEAPVNDTRVHTVEPCVDLGSRLPFMGGACGGVVSAFA